MTDIQAVVFDWRGTLVTGLDPRSWIREGLRVAGREADEAAIGETLASVVAAAGEPDRLQGPTVDTSADLHRETYYGVFEDAGLDPEVADALYAVESDPRYNQFAVDVAPVMQSLVMKGRRIGVLSDIHFDLRAVFAEHGLLELVDSFVLSFEHGAQKPDPVIFRVAVDALGGTPAETLMVGDRASHDGAAVSVGMPTLLVPPLTDVGQRRLHLVDAMVPARAADTEG